MFVPMLTSLPIVRRAPEVLSTLGRATAGEEVVDKHCSVRNEAIVADADEFADKRVGLDPAAFPMTTPRWISTKGPTNESSPMVHPYKLTGSMTVTFDQRRHRQCRPFVWWVWDVALPS